MWASRIISEQNNRLAQVLAISAGEMYQTMSVVSAGDHFGLGLK